MKKYLFAGFVILLPATLTILIIYFLFHFFTAPFVPIVSNFLPWIQQHLPFALPRGLHTFLARILALVFLSFFVLLLGFVTRYLIFSTLLKWTHSLFYRIPLIKSIYKVSRDIISALFDQNGKKIFKGAVMVPFPDKPNYAVGFVSGEVPEECSRKIDEPLSSVFAPTAPHPISGFLLLVPKKHVHPIDMTNEEMLKFLVSCGVVIPE